MAQYEETLLLGDCLDHFAKVSPDHVVVECRGKSYTYAAFAAAVDKCAHAMYANGLRKGSCVAVLSAQRIEILTTFFAAARLGILWLGVNPKYQLREMRHVIGDSKPTMLFGIESLDGRDYGPDIDSLRSEYPNIEKFIGFDGTGAYDTGFESWVNSDFCADDEAGYKEVVNSVTDKTDGMLIYTSGSSGKPKGVLLPQKAILKRALIQRDYFPVDPYPVLLCPLPITHVGGIIVLPLFTIVSGGKVILTERFSPDEFIEAMINDKINMVGAVPAMHMMLMQHPKFSMELYQKLDWILWSGAKMSEDMVEILYNSKCNLGSTYGTTESSASVTFATINDSSVEVMSKTIGKPGPNGEVRIANDETVCAAGDTGELQIRPEYSMTGYLNNQQATKAAFTKDGWYKTGDIGNMRKDGNIEFTSRISEMFVSGGENIYPLEIEQTLDSHPDIIMSAVIDIDDEVFEQVGWAYIMAKPGTELNDEKLKHWCRGEMVNYKIPKRFIFMFPLPMLPIGKIDKVSLKKMALEELEE
ncbi:MAG: acyl--CoA ligase [Kordiimonadaceae bacterium]|jgi:acyl-CoA synthetase (AMP-forming)/AMP-acid ligase II|nr:acyl--CoA ligase [Kordiimonadaceae bacterium]MBT6032150.1 acyl--CoA ligase [Kordiimonadaceae bacterium]